MSVMIIIICGLPGVGKTTVAKGLSPLISAVVLATDKIRKELFSKPMYGRKERRLIYDVMILVAKYLDKAGINCILDATFTRESSRREIKEKLGLASKDIHIIECVCPEDIVFSRLRQRKHDYSDADFSVYRKMKRIYEPVKVEHMTVDTSMLSKTDIRSIATKILKRR
jgi:predicted kinase